MAKEAKAENGKMKRKAYEAELRELQVQLCHLQDWVKEKGRRIIILSLIPFEKVSQPKVKLPKRSKHKKYDDQAGLKGRNFVAERYC